MSKLYLLLILFFRMLRSMRISVMMKTEISKI